LRLRNIFNIEAAVILLTFVSVIVAYWRDSLVLLDDALRSDMASYVLALPFLIFYMLYKRRNLLKAQLCIEAQKEENVVMKNIIAVALCLSALFLYVYGSFTFNVLQYHLVSLVIYAAGCTVFMLGIHNLKNVAFPLCLLLLLLLPYREEIYQFSGQLSLATSNLTFSLLRALGYPVTLSSLYESPSIVLRTASGEDALFVIDVPCAGAYSLIGFSVFALFFAYLSYGSLIKKALWLLVGFGLIYMGNIARLSLIIIVGYWYGAEVAMGLFHLMSGSILLFVMSLLTLIIGEKFFNVRLLTSKRKGENCSLCGEYEARKEPFCSYCGRFFDATEIKLSKIDATKILLFSLLFAVLVNNQVPSFTLSEQNILEVDIHEVSGSQETQVFLPKINGYEPRFVYRDSRFESLAQQDAALLYVFQQPNSSHAPIFASIEVADSYSKIHRWEICLYVVPAEGGVQLVTPIETRDIQILENPPLTGRLFAFKYLPSNQTVMILYWYEKAAFKIGGVWVNRYVKTGLIAYLDLFVKTGEISSVNDYASLEENLTRMAEAIINYWEPVKQWSAYTVIFGQYGQAYAIASVAMASTLYIFLYIRKRRRIEDMARSTYKQLLFYSTFSEEEKDALKVLEALSDKMDATAAELEEAVQQKTGKRMRPEEILKMLEHLERHGLVESAVIEKGKDPVLAWRTVTTFKM
jgi:exosortase